MAPGLKELWESYPEISRSQTLSSVCKRSKSRVPTQSAKPEISALALMSLDLTKYKSSVLETVSNKSKAARKNDNGAGKISEH